MVASTPGHSVFVVGAGASLAEAQARRPKRTREHPPLDATFFERVATRRTEYRDNTGASLYDRVERQARVLGESALTGLGLEEFLGRLYFNVHHDPMRTSVRDYFTLVDLYAREVVGTTNWMIGRRPSRHRSELLRQMIQRELASGQEASIVTFNIDLLIENTLQILTSTRVGAPWSLQHAYGLTTPYQVLYGPSDYFAYAGPRPPIQLYKLHGSVNWVFHVRDYYPPADLMENKRTVYQLADKQLGTRRIRHTEKGKRNWLLFPLIVPPVYEKHRLIRTHLHEQWAGAEAALDAATSVVFWGYSFPRADTHARHFFRTMSQRNPALRQPATINPDPNAARALWDVLRPNRVAHYRDAETFLAAAL